MGLLRLIVEKRLLVDGCLRAEEVLEFLFDPLGDEMTELHFLVVVGLEPDGLLELLEVLFDRPVGEVVGSIGVVEGLVLPRPLPQTVMIIEALLSPPRLAVALPKLTPALLDHLSCL